MRKLTLIMLAAVMPSLAYAQGGAGVPLRSLDGLGRTTELVIPRLPVGTSTTPIGFDGTVATCGKGATTPALLTCTDTSTAIGALPFVGVPLVYMHDGNSDDTLTWTAAKVTLTCLGAGGETVILQRTGALSETPTAIEATKACAKIVSLRVANSGTCAASACPTLDSSDGVGVSIVDDALLPGVKSVANVDAICVHDSTVAGGLRCTKIGSCTSAVGAQGLIVDLASCFETGDTPAGSATSIEQTYRLRFRASPL